MALARFKKDKPENGSSLVSSVMRNNFNALAQGDTEALKVSAQDTPDMTVKVNPSNLENYYEQCWLSNSFPINFSGGNSAEITKPTLYPRIDLLSLDENNNLKWTTGTENVNPTPPACPDNEVPLAYIYCKPSMTKIVNFEDKDTYPDEGYIYKDIRPFISLGGSGGQSGEIQFIERTDDPATPSVGVRMYDKNGNIYYKKKTGIVKQIPETTDDLPEGSTNRYDNNNVKLTGDQTVNGVKTFESIPVLPSSDPTSDNQAVRKKYVDDKTTQILIVVDEKPNGTHGGTFTSGAWRTRDLNTIRYNTISGASLSSNQIELPAGTYIVSASAPHKQVEQNKIKIRDITGSSDLIIGQNSKMSESDKDTSPAILCGKFTLSTTSKIELQHRCSNTVSSEGFGHACSFGVVEVYSQVYIEKVG